MPFDDMGDNDVLIRVNYAGGFAFLPYIAQLLSTSLCDNDD